MKNKGIIILLIMIILGIFLLGNLSSQKVTAPQTFSVSPTTTPIPTPIQYRFDSSTDLKKELDSVDPIILDNDFDNLKNIVSQL